MPKNNLRQPSAAGKFYPASADLLTKEINSLLKNEKTSTSENVLALMVPHAGYKYAGKVMASAYSKIKDRNINTVIIIGNSHHSLFDGISVYSSGGYKTPLGEVEIDSAMANLIIEKNEKISFNSDAHKEEHSIEVQLPFLQNTLKEFKIIPILLGNDLIDNCKMLSEILVAIIGDRKDILVIASSDMSHYPAYDDAVKVDNEVLKTIQTGDEAKLEKLLLDLEIEIIPNGVSFLCGSGAVKTVMLLAKDLGANKIDILKYMNSGDTISDKGGVVGYGAVSFSF
ncbi:AmmeMemoRadiSam system protein B [Patescibacteria group bacterium]